MELIAHDEFASIPSIGEIGSFVSGNAGKLALGAVGAGVVGGGIMAIASATSKKKTKKRTSKKRKTSRAKRRTTKKRRTKTKHTKKTSHKRIRHTKNGQPYIILASGKARFIKKSSCSRSRKLKGGRY